MHIAVPSLSTPDVTYTVTVDGPRISCDCPAASFGRGQCKHAKIVAGALAFHVDCMEAGHEGLCVPCLARILAMTMVRAQDREEAATRAAKAQARERDREKRAKRRQSAQGSTQVARAFRQALEALR